MFEKVFAIFVEFAKLSLLAIGGASATLAEIHRYLVDTNAWLSNDQFYALYAISQAAPGPNVQFVAAFGWQVAGIWGGVAGYLGMCGPSGMFAIGFEALASKYKNYSWPTLLKHGLAPFSIGLLLANGWFLARSIDISIEPLILTVLTILLSLRFRIAPLWLIAGGAILGALLIRA